MAEDRMHVRRWLARCVSRFVRLTVERARIGIIVIIHLASNAHALMIHHTTARVADATIFALHDAVRISFSVCAVHRP